MNFYSLAVLVRVVAELFVWIVIASVILSYFMPPYHPVRQALDRIVEPFLAPIRRVVPTAGMIDFSPMILIIAVELIKTILISIFISLS
ncbi:MAG: YggT family protein [Chloroflexi bacterium]|nr:YggT family protein [Chloroflexota bacterium]